MKKQILFLFFLGIVTLTKCPAQINWQQKANKPTKSMCNGVSFNGKIYVSYTNSTGNICIEEYNPATDQWITQKGTSHSQNFGAYCFVATKTGMYILGGYSGGAPTKTIEEYDPVLDTFRIKEDMPVAIDCASALSVEGKIYIMGGATPTSAYISSAYEYNPVTETWKTLKNMPRIRREHYSLFVEGNIYVWGGLSADLMDNRMDVYNIQTNTWTTGNNNFESPKWGYGMGYAKGSIYLLLGTFTYNSGSPILEKEEIVRYDLLQKTYQKIGINEYATWQKATVSLNDTIYMIGGLSGIFPTGQLHNTTLAFTPSSQTSSVELRTNEDISPINVKYISLTRNIEINSSATANTQSTITITGIDGKIRYFYKWNNLPSHTAINVDDVPPGIYIVKVTSGKYDTAQKILID